MPKLDKPLTDKVLDKLPTPSTGNTLWFDPELKGFTGRVTSKGARAYVGCYTFEGLERRDTIGLRPIWKAGAAREIFKRWKRDADLGIDPRGAPESEAPETFKTLAFEFLTHGRTKRGRLLRSATLIGYRRALFGYLMPLHVRSAADVKRSDAAAQLRIIAMKHGPTTAMRTRAAGSRFYSWLIANGKVEANPFTGTEGYEMTRRTRTLSDGELAVLWAATADDTDFSMIVRILIWCGCRRGEAGSMKWTELIDGLWVVPSERVKNHRTLVLPIPRQMREALDTWPRRLGRDHLFGTGPNGFQAWSQSKRRLDARLNFRSDFDLHDVRRTVETRMAGLGIPKDHVNRVLNHAAGPVTESYDMWSYMPEKASALGRWADTLEQIVRTAPSVVRLTKDGKTIGARG
jgi:integrase